MTGPLSHQWPLPKVEPVLAAALFDFLIKAATRVPPAPIESRPRASAAHFASRRRCQPADGPGGSSTGLSPHDPWRVDAEVTE